MIDDIPDRVAKLEARLEALASYVDGLRVDVNSAALRHMLCNHKKNTLMLDAGIQFVDAIERERKEQDSGGDDVNVEDRLTALGVHHNGLVSYVEGLRVDVNSAASRMVTLDDLRRILWDETGYLRGSIDAKDELDALERERKEQNNGEGAAVQQPGGVSVRQPAQGGLRSDHAHPAAPSLSSRDHRLDLMGPTKYAEPARTWQPEAPPAGSAGTSTGSTPSLSISDAMEALRICRNSWESQKPWCPTALERAVIGVLAAWDRDFRRDLVEEAEARAEKAEAALADAHKQIANLTNGPALQTNTDVGETHGECEELRKSIDRLQTYCQRHKLPGIGMYVDECVTAECDRLRAALKVERENVDAMRDAVFIEVTGKFEYAGIKHRATLARLCLAVDALRECGSPGIEWKDALCPITEATK